MRGLVLFFCFSKHLNQKIVLIYADKNYYSRIRKNIKMVKDYQKYELHREELDPSPVKQFKRWYQQAMEVAGDEAEVMALATATENGMPAVRFVLFKEIDDFGFVFYTNYSSRKGREISKNPYAAAAFYWDKMERQVRVEGKVEKLPNMLSEKYFDSRPENSRIASIVSPQSDIIPSREFLEEKAKKINIGGDEDEKLKRPDNWGGYRILPEVFEFWQGREGRLNDRFRYLKTTEGWKIDRLAP